MKYSIITINFNHRDGLQETIRSVISQSCKDYEFIVIDGGSTDGSREVIENYINYISYWVSEPDKGIYNAMNKGIMVANGDYLIFMNSGDAFYNEKVLEDSLPYMHYDIVQGYAKNLDSSQSIHCLVKIPNREYGFSPSVHHQASFFRKKLFDNSLYDENYKIVSDWKFYIEQLILYNSSFFRMPVVVAMYEGGGLSESQRELDFEERKDILEKISKRINQSELGESAKELMRHSMFTSKIRYILNREMFDITKYINTFPEVNTYYNYYPFNKKQKFLFYLAEHKIIWLINTIMFFQRLKIRRLKKC